MSYRHTASWVVGPYVVHSFGNGAAYELECPADNLSVWLQCDDAADFRDRYNDADRLSAADNDLRCEVIADLLGALTCS